MSARPGPLVARMRAFLVEAPLTFYEVVQRLEDEDYRAVLQAWGDLRAAVTLVVDTHGRYRLADAPAQPIRS
jgi:hypothetical protein